jgi:hypothetical protein
MPPPSHWDRAFVLDEALLILEYGVVVDQQPKQISQILK